MTTSADADALPESWKAYDAFLSHNTRDKPAVQRIDTHLRAFGLRLWLDVRELGDEWHGPMQAAIDEVPACVIFLGPNGWGRWQHREAQLADSRHVDDPAFRVIPVLLPGVTDEQIAELPRWLTQYRYVDFRAGLDDPDRLGELRARLLGISGREEGPDSDLENVECPYQGLEAFDASQARFFYGREADVERLLQKLKDARFLAVLGPSGSGKSSVVLAGLLPQLQAGALPGSSTWKIQVFRPGADPLASLAQAATLQSAHQAVYRTLDELADDARALDGLSGLILTQDPSAQRVIWVVDQAEEMFTLCSDEGRRARFLENLLYAATNPAGRAVVILTMRADFYAGCAQYPDLARLLEANQYLVGPLTEDGLRRAIVDPAGQLGRTFEPGLVETILDDVRQQPGALPLLQYALRELWDRQEGHMLTLKGYRDTGGVGGALAKRADSVYNGLSTEQQRIARSTLLQLTQPHEGMDATRRRAALRQLVPRDDARQAVETVVQELVAARLLTTDRQGSDEWVDVAHEALIRNWGRLRSWVEEDSSGLRLLHQLQDAADEWHTHGQSEDDLWRGARLAQILEWQTQHEDMLSDDARAFLEASASYRDREVREAEERRERESQTAREIAAQAQRLAAERKKRTYVLAAGLLVALLVGAVALVQKSAADAARGLADQQRAGRLTELVASQALDRLGQRDLSLLLGVEASQRPGGDAAEVRRALMAGLTTSPSLTAFLYPPVDQRTDWVGGVAISPDGKLLAAGGDNGAVMLWDTASDRLLAPPMASQAGRIWSVAFSPDGQTLATASADNSIVLWDAATRQPRGAPLQGHTAPVHSVAFSPDGRLLASSGEDNEVRLWDAASGAPVGNPLRGHTGMVRAVAFSPDGATLASGSDDGTIRLWDPTTGQQRGQALGGTGADPVNSGVSALAFSPDRTNPVLAAGTWDGTYALWDLSKGQVRGEPVSVSSTPTLSVAFARNGGMLLTGSVDGNLRLWNVATGKRIDQWTGQGGPVNSVAASPTGSLIATGGANGSVALWDGPNHNPLWTSLVPAQTVPVLALALPTGSGTLVAGTGDGTTERWDVTSGSIVSRPAAFTGNPLLVSALSFSPDARLMAMSSNAGTSTIWDTSNTVVARLDTGADYFPFTIAFSPQGHLVASGGCASSNQPTCSTGEVRLWQASGSAWQPFGSPLEVQAGAVGRVAFSPDEKLLATVSGGTRVTLWDLATGQVVGQPATVGTSALTAATFSPDGATLAVAALDGSIHLIRATDGQPTGPAMSSPDGAIASLVFAPDGKSLVTGLFSGVVVPWDVSTGQEGDALVQPLSSIVSTLAFSSDGRVLTAADRTGFIHFWDWTTGRPLHDAVLATGAGVEGVAYSADGQELAAGTSGGGVSTWDLGTSNLSGITQAPGPYVDHIAYSPRADQRLLAISSGAGGALGFWDTATETSPTWQRAAVVGGGLAFSADGQTVAVGGCGQATTLVQCGQGAVQLWDVGTAKTRGNPMVGGTSMVESVAYRPDGQRVAAGFQDGSILVWDTATGQPVGQPLRGHTSDVVSLAFSPDGKLLASGGRDTDVILWDAASGQMVGQPLKGHTNTIFALGFSPDGKTLASGSADITIRLWDVASHLPIGALDNETAWVTSLMYKPGDSHTLAAGSTDGYVAFWDLDPASWERRACAIAGRDLTPEEWRQYLGDEPYHATCSSLPVPAPTEAASPSPSATR